MEKLANTTTKNKSAITEVNKDKSDNINENNKLDFLNKSINALKAEICINFEVAKSQSLKV